MLGIDIEATDKTWCARQEKKYCHSGNTTRTFYLSFQNDQVLLYHYQQQKSRKFNQLQRSFENNQNKQVANSMSTAIITVLVLIAKQQKFSNYYFNKRIRVDIQT